MTLREFLNTWYGAGGLAILIIIVVSFVGKMFGMATF